MSLHDKTLPKTNPNNYVISPTTTNLTIKNPKNTLYEMLSLKKILFKSLQDKLKNSLPNPKYQN